MIRLTPVSLNSTFSL